MTDPNWIKTNRENWDDRATAHMRGGGDYYDIAGVRAGRSSLMPMELELVGDVNGCRLLHLMCHIGLDSISWARKGARVTAVDLSPVSIDAARNLAIETGVDVDFCVGDVYALPEQCDGPFSVVVMTYGVLCWIRDIPALLRIVARRLESGGRFVLIDGHPLTNLWTDKSVAENFRPRADSYFAKLTPELCERPRSYGGGGTLTNSVSFQWQHHIGEMVQAVIDAGLGLRAMREEPFGFYRRYPGMIRRTDGYLDPPPSMSGLPLLFAILAEKI